MLFCDKSRVCSLLGSSSASQIARAPWSRMSLLLRVKVDRLAQAVSSFDSDRIPCASSWLTLSRSSSSPLLCSASAPNSKQRRASEPAELSSSSSPQHVSLQLQALEETAGGKLVAEVLEVRVPDGVEAEIQDPEARKSPKHRAKSLQAGAADVVLG
eukprot:749208-Hanusia_phi.AAC.1